MSNAIIITVKVVLVALVAIRLLTLGYFGTIVSNVVSITLAYTAVSKKNSLHPQIQEIFTPLEFLKERRNSAYKLAVSLIVDLISTPYVPLPLLVKPLFGGAGFSPLATFMSMYLYERPVLSACDMLEGTVPFADFIPTCTIGWLLDNRIIREEWFRGVVQKV